MIGKLKVLLHRYCICTEIEYAINRCLLEKNMAFSLSNMFPINLNVYCLFPNMSRGLEIKLNNNSFWFDLCSI